jgi:hypothetical protein
MQMSPVARQIACASNQGTKSTTAMMTRGFGTKNNHLLDYFHATVPLHAQFHAPLVWDQTWERVLQAAALGQSEDVSCNAWMCTTTLTASWTRSTD